jgi:hypothetical protein
MGQGEDGRKYRPDTRSSDDEQAQNLFKFAEYLLHAP